MSLLVVRLLILWSLKKHSLSQYDGLSQQAHCLSLALRFRSLCCIAASGDGYFDCSSFKSSCVIITPLQSSCIYSICEMKKPLNGSYCCGFLFNPRKLIISRLCSYSLSSLRSRSKISLVFSFNPSGVLFIAFPYRQITTVISCVN